MWNVRLFLLTRSNTLENSLRSFCSNVKISRKRFFYLAENAGASFEVVNIMKIN